MVVSLLLVGVYAVSTTPAPTAPVDVELLATVTHVAPGASFELAVRLAIEEGWHVYGEYPGDTGIATRVRIDAPEGFVVGAARYPAPVRAELEGLTSYVYEHEVALFVPVTAPAELAAGDELAFRAHASWLVCKESCIPGRADAELELAVRAEEAGPANADALAKQRARLPRPWKELAGARLAWVAGEDALEVAVTDATELEFLPAEGQPWRLAKAVAKGGGRLKLALEPDGDEPGAPRVRGALRVRWGEREGFFALEAVRDR